MNKFLTNRRQAQLESFYRDVVISKIQNVVGLAPVSLQDFQHAYSLVSSRAFKVDAYHVIAMVPVADACVPSLGTMTVV